MAESYNSRNLLFKNVHTSSPSLPDSEFEKLKAAAHEKFNIENFTSQTLKVKDINCYFYAIGIDYLPNNHIQRLGVISGKKIPDGKYTQNEDLNSYFQADMDALGLKTMNLNIDFSSSKDELFSKIENENLSENQYIVLLYKQVYPGNANIFRDFHFIRYDKENGFTEKRRLQYPNKIDTRYWISSEFILLGAYKVTQ